MIVANLKEVIGVSVGDTEIKEVWTGDSKVFPDGPTPPAPSGYYYIYRTSSNIIERRDIAQYPTVNFPAIAGNSYGGVFTDYGGKGTIATALANGDPVTFVDDRVWDNGIGYIGESNVSGATLMFDGNNAITTGTTAYTPTVGVIYYVKEVPDWILTRNQAFTYSKSSPYPIVNYYLISAFDSLAYSAIVCRFKEESQSTFETLNLNVSKSLTIGSTTYTPQIIGRTKGLFASDTGYVCYTADIFSKFEVGKTYIVYFEATTPDGIVIHSPVKSELVVNNLNRTGIKPTDMPFEPITYDAQVEYIETSSDNCSISIGKVASTGYRFEIDAYIPSSSAAGYLFGIMETANSNLYAFTPCDENGLSSYKYWDGSSPTSSALEGRYTFSNRTNINVCVVTNGTNTITYTCSNTANHTMYRLIYALGLNENGGARKTIKGIKLYSMKIYTSTGTLNADLIPVRKDGRGYLYDKEDGTKLLAPKGDPITVYGADVVE